MFALWIEQNRPDELDNGDTYGRQFEDDSGIESTE